MRAAFLAGLAYFAAVFIAGLALGTARVLAVEPRVGAFPAVLIELPIILWFAWWTCRRLIEQLDVPRSAAPAIVMGSVALLLLMMAEAGLALWTPGRSAAELLLQYGEPAAALGLLGQVLFALFPLLQVAWVGAPKEATS